MPRANWLRYDADQTDGQLIASNYQRQWVGRSSMTFLSLGLLGQQQPDKSDTKVISTHRYSTLGCVCVISSFHDENVGSFSLSYTFAFVESDIWDLRRYKFREKSKQKSSRIYSINSNQNKAGVKSKVKPRLSKAPHAYFKGRFANSVFFSIVCFNWKIASSQLAAMLVGLLSLGYNPLKKSESSAKTHLLAHVHV